jgi:hypothetical protein
VAGVVGASFGASVVVVFSLTKHKTQQKKGKTVLKNSGKL